MKVEERAYASLVFLAPSGKWRTPLIKAMRPKETWCIYNALPNWIFMDERWKVGKTCSKVCVLLPIQPFFPRQSLIDLAWSVMSRRREGRERGKTKGLACYRQQFTSQLMMSFGWLSTPTTTTSLHWLLAAAAFSRPPPNLPDPDLLKTIAVNLLAFL